MKQYTQEEIYKEIVDLLNKLFEVNPTKVTMDSKLAEELDLDSIDAVDMIVELQKRTGKRIKPEEFQSVKTVGDVVTVLERLLKEQQTS